mmetsp:Transcript_43530/g.52655  ORF Transcript_43530/g.52655 Transcript_43530/m.52655 type:complete len:121 (-) Transcript_43530:1095-1457(-)
MFQQRYPGVPIVGSNYEPSAQKKAIAQAVSLTSYAVMGITLGGDALFEALGMPPPTLDIYKGMIENQFYSCAGSYFIGNTVAAVCKLDPKAHWFMIQTCSQHQYKSSSFSITRWVLFFHY